MLSVSQRTEQYIMSTGRTFKAAIIFDSGEKLNSRIISCEVSFTTPEEDIRPGMVLSSQASITSAEDIGSVEGRHFYLYLLPTGDAGGETYGDLADMTHAALHSYTHAEITALRGEPIPMGRFKATSVKVTGSRTTIEAHDDLYGADGKFTTGREFPCSSLLIEQDICNVLGIVGLGHSFEVTLTAPPEDCTYREMLGYIAALDGGRHTMLDRRGYLIHKDMTDSGYTISKSRSAEPEVQRGAIEITDLTCEVSEGVTYETESTAVKKRRITFTNPYMTRAIFDTIALKYVGLSYKPLTVRYIMGDPRLELLDRVTVQGREGSFAGVPITNITYSFDGGLSSNLTAGGKTDSESKAAEGPMSRYIKSLVASSKNATEQELKEAMKAAVNYVFDPITTGVGGYHFQAFNADGKLEADYWTDNPDLSKATNIIMINRNGILGTNTGLNGTWKAAITNDGRINASQILTGELSAILIKSLNYSGTSGSMIDLSDGTFSFAGGKLTYNGRTLDIEGKVTVSDSDSKAILDDAKLKLYRDDDYIGFIGTQTIISSDSHNGDRGIVFDLTELGDYLSWGAKDSASAETYTQKLAWFRDDGFVFGDDVRVHESADITFSGTPTSGSKLDCYRVIDMHNYTISNTTIVNSSDRRLKDNIKDSEVNATEIINALKPKQFYWKESDEFCELGFIADEMQAVRKDFAAELPDGMQGIKLLETVPYLIKAFQELDERVRKLEHDN